MKARFCLQRALETYGASRLSNGADMTMLILAGLGGGVGTSVGAAASAMDDTNSSRKDLGIASVTTLAAAGAILGLRAALNLNEIGRTQRIAAARDVNAAISVLEKYALADDPKDVIDDGFATCRDEDVNIANAFPGAASAEPLEKLVSKTKEEKSETEKAASEAKTAETEAKTAAQENRDKVAKLQKFVDSQRAAPRTSAADPQLQQAEKDLENAKAAQAELDTKAKETEKQAEIESTRAQIAAAQADVSERKLAVVRAGSQLRRAVFYLTGRDVDLAKDLLEGNVKALELSRQNLVKSQQHLDNLLFPQSGASPASGTKP